MIADLNPAIHDAVSEVGCHNILVTSIWYLTQQQDNTSEFNWWLAHVVPEPLLSRSLEFGNEYVLSFF